MSKELTTEVKSIKQDQQNSSFRENTSISFLFLFKRGASGWSLIIKVRKTAYFIMLTCFLALFPLPLCHHRGTLNCLNPTLRKWGGICRSSELGNRPILPYSFAWSSQDMRKKRSHVSIIKSTSDVMISNSCRRIQSMSPGCVLQIPGTCCTPDSPRTTGFPSLWRNIYNPRSFICINQD